MPPCGWFGANVLQQVGPNRPVAEMHGQSEANGEVRQPDEKDQCNERHDDPMGRGARQ